MQTTELDAVADVFAKAFCQDSNTAYFFGLERPLLHAGNITDSKDLRLLRRIRRYHRILVDMIFRGGGEVDVLVVPGEDGELGRVVGVAAWLKPGRDIDPPITRILFSGILMNLLRSLGLSGLTVCFDSTL